MAKRKKKDKKVYNPIRKKARRENRIYRKLQKQQLLLNLEKSQQRIQSARRINDAFDFAKSKYGGSQAFARNLSVLLQQIMGVGYDAKAGDSNEYFEISNDYTGNDTELFRYIKFKKLPESSKIDTLTNIMLSNDLASEEKYQQAQERIHQEAWKTFTSRNNLDVLDGKKAQVLYDIMNSSAAWHIAQQGTFESDQVAEEWLKLYNHVSGVVDSNSTLLDDIVRMIDNEEDINTIIHFLDVNVYSKLGE